MLQFSEINVCYLGNKAVLIYVLGHFLGTRAVWLLTGIIQNTLSLWTYNVYHLGFPETSFEWTSFTVRHYRIRCF